MSHDGVPWDVDSPFLSTGPAGCDEPAVQSGKDKKGEVISRIRSTTFFKQGTFSKSGWWRKGSGTHQIHHIADWKGSQAGLEIESRSEFSDVSLGSRHAGPKDLEGLEAAVLGEPPLVVCKGGTRVHCSRCCN